jgi:sugar-specific transcriptional regulator TrmB
MMADDNEFLSRLIGFGLSEKEAQLYFHLLKYGPKPPSLLAKSLKTYREDVHRTLTGLVDKGMVNPSLESPTVYAAADLEIALDSALKKHESELREMEIKKRELKELSEKHRFSPSDEFATFKIIKSLKEDIAVAMSLINSVEKDWLMVIPEIAIVVSSLYGVTEASKKLIDRGGKIRIITDFSYPAIELVQQLLEIGVDLRHYHQYQGIIFAVFERKTSISAINVDIRSVSLNETISALWTDDATYAEYLVCTFELLWEQSVPAAQRIEELLEEGPPRI